MPTTAEEQKLGITTTYDENGNVVHTYKGIFFNEFYHGVYIDNQLVSSYQLPGGQTFNSLQAIIDYIDFYLK